MKEKVILVTCSYLQVLGMTQKVSDLWKIKELFHTWLQDFHGNNLQVIHMCKKVVLKEQVLILLVI